MISVIMPAYNSAKTIKNSVDSVLNQTLEDWELIVIDDGSSDETSLILEDMASKDSRIRFYKNAENSGVSYTRNRAISLSQGEWIAFLDSDDMWAPEKLQKQLSLLQRYPEMVICYTASSFVDMDGKPYEYVMQAVEQMTYDMLLRKNLLSCSSVMIRASVMKNIKMPSDSMHEDYYVWLTVLRSCKVAYGINEPLLIYRLSSDSKSSNRFKSAKMLYNSYRAVGYSVVVSFAYVLRYTLHSVSKRYNIYKYL